MSAKEPAVDSVRTPAPKVETSSDAKVSSYANILAVEKEKEAKKAAGAGKSDTANSGKSTTATTAPATKPTENKTYPTAAASDPNQNEQKTPATTDGHGNEIEDDDDSEFTPVVSHNRKDRNQRKNNANNKERAGNGGEASSGGRQAGSKRAPRAERERKEGKDGKEGRRPRGKRTDKDKNANVEQSAGADAAIAKTASNSSNGEDSADDPTTANENNASAAQPAKFVEAPLPKVNAWKVCIQHFRYSISIYILSICSVFGYILNLVWFACTMEH